MTYHERGEAPYVHSGPQDCRDYAQCHDRVFGTLGSLASAMLHPFYVSVYTSDRMPVTVVGFQHEDEARAFASMRPEPVIYLTARQGPRSGHPEVIGTRTLTRHPDAPRDFGMITRDDFPDNR